MKKILGAQVMLFFGAAIAQPLYLECDFRHMSFDTLGRKWEERRRDTLVVDAETGRVKDGGIAMIISRSERAKTTITINAFKATGSGKIDGTDGLMDLQVGFYEIDRLTGSYKARVVLNSRLVPGSSVMSTTEEDGVCKLGSRKF